MSLKVPVINEFLVQFTQIVVPMDMTFTRMLECVRNQARKKKKKKKSSMYVICVSEAGNAFLEPCVTTEI